MNDIAAATRGERITFALDRLFDRPFGPQANPLRQLGALGFHLFWIVAATGAYVYIFYDTSAQGAWSSLQALDREQPWAGGVLRSVHRYASDALVLVTLLHLLREWALGRYRGFRWFTWVSGVPLLWLIGASGLVGFWLVWDRLAAWVAVTSLEWAATLPGFGVGLVRNAVVPENVSDRLFSLLIFLHIGISLLLLLGMWIHIQRLTRAATRPQRRLGTGLIAALALLALARPAPLLEPAALLHIDGSLPIDWYYMAPLPAAAAAPLATWGAVAGLTLLLVLLPWLPGGEPRDAAARVDAANCNGCGRCFADCPYGAVVMVPRTGGRSHLQLARVDADLCAACGICVGACPSATPFRSVQQLVSGIDMPGHPLEQLRGDMSAALAGPPRTLVFSCARGARAGTIGSPEVAVLPLTCAAQLPPAFVDFALRNGADGVVLASCSDAQCAFRLGAEWAHQRLDGLREPRLRGGVDSRRVLFVAADRGEEPWLREQVETFRRGLATLPAQAGTQEAGHHG